MLETVFDTLISQTVDRGIQHGDDHCVNTDATLIVCPAPHSPGTQSKWRLCLHGGHPHVESPDLQSEK